MNKKRIKNEIMKKKKSKDDIKYVKEETVNRKEKKAKMKKPKIE